jgi:hypothetical protein
MVRAKVVDRDLGWRAMLKAVDSLAGGSYAKVGVLADDSKGGAETDGGLTVAELATVLEFGTDDGRIPSRPFLRDTFDEKRDELKQNASALLFKILDGKQSVGGALNILGMKLASETKKTITTGEGVPPPNAPSTIERKSVEKTRILKSGWKKSTLTLNSRPLVDTGRLLNAITWSVEMSNTARALSGGE